MAAVNLPNNNLTFVHIPKNGGSSVVEWLIENFETQTHQGHPSLTMMQEWWDIKRTFAIVRNPWSRVVSTYFYLKQYGFYWSDNNINHVDEFPTWNDFVMKLDYNTKSWNSITTNQVEWMGNGVDYILRMENLNKEFKVIQELLNCNAPLLKLNTSDHDDYRKYFNDEQIQRVAKVFEKDIDLFKYTF